MNYTKHDEFDERIFRLSVSPLSISASYYRMIETEMRKTKRQK